MGLSIVPINFQSLFISFYSGVYIAFILQRQTQIIVDFNKIWRGFKRKLIAINSRLEPSKSMLRTAHFLQHMRIARIGFQRFLTAVYCRFPIAFTQKSCHQNKMGLTKIWPEPQSRLQRFNRLVKHPLLDLCLANIAIVHNLIRFKLQSLFKVVDRTIKIALLLERAPNVAKGL